MKQKYKEMQERLLPGKEMQEEMWARIVKQSIEDKRKPHRKYLKTGVIGSVVAAVLICMVCLSQNGLAGGIKRYIRLRFTNQSDITEDIQKNTYSYQDDHVKMQVKEMLSDGNSVFMGIRYTALDQEGKEWLAGLDPDKAVDDWDDLIISGVEEESDEDYNVGWGQSLVEQKNLATEKEKHFIFSFFYDGDASVSAKGNYTFRYSMPEGFKEFQVPRKSNLDTLLYQVGENDASKERFDLRYLNITKLSFRLLVQKNSKYDYDEWGRPDAGKIAFIMKDGSKKMGAIHAGYTPMKDSELMKLVPGSEEEYIIVWGGFIEQSDSEEWATIDNPDEVVAVEISGDRYEYGDGLYRLTREK